MAIDEQGRAGERLIMDWLIEKGTKEKFQPDCMFKWRDKWICAEVKNQQMFKAPPFDGHGLPPYQVERRLQFQRETGIRVLLFVHEEGTDTVYYQWLDLLDRGKKALTQTGKRVIYPLSAFESFHLSKDIMSKYESERKKET